jgi:hypothetical protein
VRFDTLLDEFVKCRTVGHNWNEIPDDGNGPGFFTRSRSTETVLWRCATCTARRYDVYSLVTGDLVDRRMVYPRDYHLPPKSGATRKLMRKEYIERTRGRAWSRQRRKKAS